MIVLTLSGASASSGVASPTVPAALTGPVTPDTHCMSARKGVVFYRSRYYHHRGKPTVKTSSQWWTQSSCSHVRDAARIWKSRAHVARVAAEYMSTIRTLRDHVPSPGNSAWTKAVKEVQRAYPGTEDWLMSCSASEGGHGRWVPNSQGSGVGGWLQFMPGTWAGFYRHAHQEVTARGFRVPASAESWYSPLGQALAGAWGVTHGMSHHWAGHGCR